VRGEVFHLFQDFLPGSRRSKLNPQLLKAAK
jgi:hypothetical protein